MNVAQMLAESASGLLTKNAIIFEGEPFTFQGIGEEINISAQLLEKLGVKKGDRVALQLSKSMEFVFLYLANLSIGGITLPLNTAYKAEEIEYFLKDSGSSFFITCKENYLALKHITDTIKNLKVLLVDGGLAGVCSYPEEKNKITGFKKLEYPVQNDDVAVICYTSGTTGEPKGAMITHRNLVDNVRALTQAWQWTDRDILLHVLPIFHVHGLHVALLGGLYAGSTIIMHRNFDPKVVWRTIEKRGCTMLMGVPTMYHRLLKQWEYMEKKPDISTMRVFISGSAPLTETLFHRFEKKTGFRILERYGMTEAGMINTNPFVEEERKAGSVGYPFPGVEIRVINADEKNAKPGEIGEIYIRGRNVFKGYWQNPEKTKEAFMGDWLKSGDLGYQDPEDGMRLRIVGRHKEMIITGGYNVYPKEVENIVDRREGVLESAVIGLPDDDFGEKVTAIVIPEENANGLNEKALIDFCKKNLAGYKCPKAVFFRQELPRNAMGKIQKRVLQAEYSTD